MGKTQDHPRRCGENGLSSAVGFRLPGSPPQVRGKLAFARTQASQDGITPAGAGKTCFRIGGFVVHLDHPRRCGENLLYLNHEDLQVGSPPQVRGKLEPVGISEQFDRITPAGAGKTTEGAFARSLT